MAVEAASAPAPAANSLAPRLRTVHVGLRADLEVTRHLFRGEPSYVVRDPLTFQSQQLSPADYAILIAITPNKTLAVIFDELVQCGKLSVEHEEDFYQFILGLHRLGLLRLPLSDDKLLYKRFVAKQAARRKEKLVGFLFLRIPLVNPDAFLDRTMHLVRPLFSRTAFVLWALLMTAALYVSISHRAELREPLDGILAARNIPLFWLTLIVLKVFHELGHAYACKHFGGHVPEMGAYLIFFTPCAYVDATACWGFTRQWERIVVCFGGMYVESIIAAMALFVWSATEPSLVHSLAFNVIFLAGTVTVLFNINPLMRYDGYYILSDVTEVPNLRARAAHFIAYLMKRYCLGVPLPPEPGNVRLKFLFFSFGLATTIYRSVIIFGLAAVIATKVFIGGLSLAAFYVTNMVINYIRKLFNFFWHSPETASIRWRAVAVSLAILLIFPVAALFAPLPESVRAAAVVGAHQETVVRAQVPGFLARIAVEPDTTVSEGTMIAELASDETEENLAEAQAILRAAQIREDAARSRDAAIALAGQDRVEAAARLLDMAQEQMAKTQLHAPFDGVFVEGVRATDVGAYLPEGAPIGRIIAGNWCARAVLTQEQMAASKPKVGQVVEFRAASDVTRTIRGRISHIASMGSRRVAYLALTQIAGGDIIIDPATQEASQPYFEVTIDLPRAGAEHLRYGMTGVARLPADPEPLATRLKRRIERFIAKLMQQ